MLSIRITDHTSGSDLTIGVDKAPIISLQSGASLAATAVEPLKLEWSKTLCDGERVNHADATKACAELGEGWRLPTRVELLSLVDDTRYDPAIDTERFPDTKSGAYWTSTEHASGSSHAWIVYFNDGVASLFHRGVSYAFVRAVRSLPAGQ